MKKMFSLILVLTMLCTLFVGCGGQDAEESTAPVSVEASAEAPETPGDSASAVEGTTVVQIDEVEVGESSIKYPVGDGDVFSIAVVMDSNFLEYVPGKDPANAKGIALMQEVTGVSFDYTVYPMMSDNMTLMIASGDMTDIICKIDESYNTGVAGALADDVIVDLAPYLEEFAPDYNTILHSDAMIEKLAINEGQVGAFYTINSAGNSVSANGFTIRTDMLEKAGIDKIPETYDELEEACVAVLAEYSGMKQALSIAPSFIGSGYEDVGLMYGYGITGTMTGGDFVLGEDGKVMSTVISDNMREYITMLSRWVEKGILNTDDMVSGDLGTMGERIYFGEALAGDTNGVTDAVADEKLDLMADDPEAKLSAMYYPTKTAGETLRFGGASSTVSTGWSISTCCENVELLIQACNWIYTQEGTVAINFGIENESFTIDEAGNYHYTELVTNNPDGAPMFMAQGIYTAFETPYVAMAETVAAKLTNEYQFAALDFVAGQNKTTDGVVLGTFTADENTAYSALYNDINTVVEEQLLKFAVGEQEITDGTWNAYVETVKSMGIDEVVEMFQVRHDRFVNS